MKTEGLHVVRPRAAGLDVHKMEITATVRLCEGEGEPVVETRCFSTHGRGELGWHDQSRAAASLVFTMAGSMQLCSSMCAKSSTTLAPSSTGGPPGP